MKFELRKGLFCDDYFLSEFLAQLKFVEKVEPQYRTQEFTVKVKARELKIEVFKTAFDNIVFFIDGEWCSKLEMDLLTYNDLFYVKPMEWEEYCSMLAFESVFCDLGVPSDYGFEGWLDAYDTIQNQDITCLRRSNGEVESVVEEFSFFSLPEALENQYLHYKHVLRGVKKHKVKLDTLEVI